MVQMVAEFLHHYLHIYIYIYIYIYVCVCARVQIFLLASSARAVCVVIQEGAQPDPAMLKQVLRGRDASPEELF